MKTNLIGKLTMFALASLLFVSCSNEDNVLSEDSQSVNVLAARGAADFNPVLTRLYGSTYRLSTQRAVNDAGVIYKVTEVTLAGATRPKGYIVETPDQDLYYEYDATRGTATEFAKTSITPLGIYDLTKDPNYNPVTFNPYTPPRVGVSRFWGWEWTGQVGSNLYQGKPCYRKMTRTYYAFWIGFSTVEDNDPDLHVPADCNSTAIVDQHPNGD